MGVNMKKSQSLNIREVAHLHLCKTCNHFSWSSINGGQIFRNEVANGMTLADFGELCSADESVDLTLDEKLRVHILDNVTNVIESRLAGWWAYKLQLTARIWLRASRMKEPEGLLYEKELLWRRQ